MSASKQEQAKPWMTYTQHTHYCVGCERVFKCGCVSNAGNERACATTAARG